MPEAPIFWVCEGKRKGRMNRLCGLQPRRKIVANNDVKLGRWDLRKCHEEMFTTTRKPCQVGRYPFLRSFYPLVPFAVTANRYTGEMEDRLGRESGQPPTCAHCGSNNLDHETDVMPEYGRVTRTSCNHCGHEQ